MPIPKSRRELIDSVTSTWGKLADELEGAQSAPDDG